MHNVILIGAGPLGLKVSRLILERPGLTLAGVVDLDPELHGVAISDLIGGVASNAVVSESIDACIAMAGERPEGAVVTTVSSIRKIRPTIQALAERGAERGHHM